MIEIKHLPKEHDKYVVAIVVYKWGGGQDFWYWGSWSDEEKAYNSAVNINGQVFVRETECE